MATDGLTALITGGTSGIGRAAALKLTQLGIHVLVVGRNRERGEKTVADIHATGGRAEFIASDLRDAPSAREVAKKAVELGGGHVDILINNAGVFPFGPNEQNHGRRVRQSVFAQRQGAVLPSRRTCPADGEEGKRSHRQRFDDGCRLWGVGHEPVRLEQGGDQSVDQVVGS